MINVAKGHQKRKNQMMNLIEDTKEHSMKRIKLKEDFRQRNIDKMKKYHSSIKEQRKDDSQFNEEFHEKERERKAKYRKKLKEKKLMKMRKLQNTETVQKENSPKVKNDTGTAKRKRAECVQKENSPKLKNDTGPAKRKRAERVRRSLPKSPRKWAETVNHIIQNSTPRKKEAYEKYTGTRKPKETRNKKQRTQWALEVKKYIQSDAISRVMPNKKDVLKIGTERVPKRHLLYTKREAYNSFTKTFPDYPYKYTTFVQSIPRHIRKMKLKEQRVCICLKCYNFGEMLKPLNEKAKQLKMNPLTLISCYQELVCQSASKFPELKCV